jgi:hypothetical protein
VDLPQVLPVRHRVHRASQGRRQVSIPVEMQVEKVTGQAAFKVLLKDSRSGGTI